MQQDGPRLRKLKEVYKRAIHEILREEEAMCLSASASESRDSFYGDNSEHPRPEDIRAVFAEMKTQFSEAFKYKLRSMNLDLKLNSLDKDIKDARVSYQSISDPKYITEIFESYTVDKKAELHRALEEMHRRASEENRVAEEEIAELSARATMLENENAQFEKEYARVVRELESACED